MQRARPSVRVDGEIQMLEGEPSYGPNDVESLLLTLVPDGNHAALRSGVATEWISDVDGIGRVRCLSFRDHRGAGGVFRMMPVRAVSDCLIVAQPETTRGKAITRAKQRGIGITNELSAPLAAELRGEHGQRRTHWLRYLGIQPSFIGMVKLED